MASKGCRWIAWHSPYAWAFGVGPKREVLGTLDARGEEAALIEARGKFKIQGVDRVTVKRWSVANTRERQEALEADRRRG